MSNRRVTEDHENAELLPLVAALIAESFPELNGRALAVTEAVITPANLPTLPLVIVAPLTQTFSDNGGYRLPTQEEFMLEFWLKPEREQTATGGETPFWTYYEYNKLRNRVKSIFAGWRGQGGTVIMRTMEIDADEFAVSISFRMRATYEECVPEPKLPECEPGTAKDGDPAHITYSLCKPIGISPDAQRCAQEAADKEAAEKASKCPQ